AVRLAFGAILKTPVGNREEGYGVLQKFLPSVRLDPAASSDFMYQINRPREVKFGNVSILINRLSRWAVEIVETRHLSPGQPLMASQEFRCNLELDINTSPDFQGELPQRKVREIFETLVDFGREIALEGDIS